jgi:DNA-binding NtrC family response regulator
VLTLGTLKVDYHSMKNEEKIMTEHKIRLLIVDDEEQFLHSIRRSLELRDFEVITATRGEEAVEIARSRPVDIALVDLKMPGMNGQETLEALKKDHPWMEIVILTGHGTIDSAASCTRSGCYSYLQKPCGLDQLLETLVDAYKKKVMNAQQIAEKKMSEIMKKAVGSSPLEILRMLKALEKKTV